MTRTGSRTLSDAVVKTVLAVSLVVVGSMAQASDSPDEGIHNWLKRMVEAVHTLNYDGTFVYLQDDRMETMRVIHTVNGGDEQERLISLNGSAREVIRDSASVTCVTPDAKSVSVGKRMFGQGFRAVFSADTSQLASNYEFAHTGESRVAGRDTKVFVIIPKDEYRYGYRIHLDAENALPLKAEMLDHSGGYISQIMFTSMKLITDTRQDYESILDGKEYYRWHQEKPKHIYSAKLNDWLFAPLPKGFVKVFQTRRSVIEGRKGIDHLILSDGLATLSVYIEERNDEHVLSGFSRMGAVNAYGIALPEHHATVVGEVPERTVEAVAKALLDGAERP